MEYDVIILAVLLLSPFPFMAAYIAERFGRKFWIWFLVSIPLPLITCLILVCFPDRSMQGIPVENEEIFKQLNGID